MAWFRAGGTPTNVDDGKKPITSSTVLEGFMGWVNGKKVTGTMQAYKVTISGSSLYLETVKGD